MCSVVTSLVYTGVLLRYLWSSVLPFLCYDVWVNPLQDLPEVIAGAMEVMMTVWQRY